MEGRGRYIPNRLRRTRWRFGYKQKVAARRMGVNQGDLSRWENGGVLPGLRTAFRFSILYGMPLEELFHGHYEEVRREMQGLEPKKHEGKEEEE